jgi:arylsulfatase A-like enzyme
MAQDKTMSNDRPNLVFIFPDEFRQQAIGCMGQDPVITPNLDQFASEGIVLTNAVSNCPVCSPYRAMLFSGKYPISNGVTVNCYSETIEDGIELSESERCFSDVLHDAGYSQGYIGKLHLDLPKKEHIPYTEGWRGEPGKGDFWDAYTPPGPRRHGFDFWHSYGCCDRHLKPHYWAGDAKVDERIDVDEWSVKHETDVAINYIRNRNGDYRVPGKPFSLFVAFNPPHGPFEEVPSQYVDPYKGKSAEGLLNRPNFKLEPNGADAQKHVKNYFADITGIDEQFGRIMQALEDEGLSDDTIVVFTSDHGEMMGSHGLMGKGVYYDESLLVPFIIRWPGRIKPGWDDLLLNAPDIMPTLLNLMDLGDHVPVDVEGTDYSAVFLGQELERPHSALYIAAHPSLKDYNCRGLRTHRHTFAIRKREAKQTVILYDNQEDPYQLADVADENPELVRELTDELGRWLEKTNDPWPKAIKTIRS